MAEAVAQGERGRLTAAPNPWVGCVIVASDGEIVGRGFHQRAGEPHAEVHALNEARDRARGATAYVTLEPCAHQGRTPPCAPALVDAGVARVVVAVLDPDERVAGRGVEILRSAGIAVDVGVGAEAAARSLGPYLHHRGTGRPLCLLKTAASLDGRTAAADGTSQWTTGPEARADAHRLRAESDAVVVGAGTVRADDPALTVRLADGDDGDDGDRQPLRVVLGHAPEGAAVRPALELSGDLGEVLDELGRRGVLQAMVEGGATVAGAFHRAGLVDRYVVYLAPALFGGADGRGLFAGAGAPSIDDVWRGRIVSVERLGDDLRVEVA
jgi:diaminohydroxyphosphoribosylaminopyrimidine deaminase/5-amino-6-(5-phosphoribosylamino)uracil reductase